MSCLAHVIRLWRKSTCVRRLGRELSRCHDRAQLDHNGTTEAELLEERLFALVENDTNLRRILTKFGAQRSDLRAIYRVLTTTNAAVRVKGHWVPASALAYEMPLRFIVSAFHTESREGEPEALNLQRARRVVRFFAQGGGRYL